MSVGAWHGVRRTQDAPFLWVELDNDQLRLAHEIRASFTEACFPRVPCDACARCQLAGLRGPVLHQRLVAGAGVGAG